MDHNLNPQNESLSLIKRYFDGKTVFLTGGTGFVGRFLVYKLLKDANVKRIYICLRAKKGQTVQHRFQAFQRLELFSFLPSPELMNRVIPLEGDVCQPDLGLSSEDQVRIVEEVNIVYHSAATIRFTEPLKSASLLHVTGTSHVVDVCRKIRNLELLVHVSSVAAWSVNHQQVEQVPDSDLDPEAFSRQLIEASETEAGNLERSLIGSYAEGKWLNTYALTKSIAELVVARSNLPKVVIVRPPFLSSPIREPQMGWFDEPQSGAGLTALFSFGIIRIGYLKHDITAEFMPIDMVVNGMLRATWYHYEVSNKRLDVFNMSSCNTQPVKVRQLLTEAIDLGYRYPSCQQIRPPIEMYRIQPSKQYVQMKSFVTHTLFCLMIDFFLLLAGKKPLLYRKTQQCKKALDAVFSSACEYKSNLNICTGNMEAISKSLTGLDQEIFFYDTSNMPLQQLCEQNHLRFRRHVLKESDDTLEYARRRLRVVENCYRLFRILVWGLTVLTVYFIHSLTCHSFILWLPFAAAVVYVARVFLIR